MDKTAEASHTERGGTEVDGVEGIESTLDSDEPKHSLEAVVVLVDLVSSFFCLRTCPTSIH